MDGNYRSLGELVRARRIQLGLTQMQLAKKISDDDQLVRQSDISRIESGRIALPRLDRLQRLATALELPFGTLLVSSNWSDQKWQPDVADGRSLAADSCGNGALNGSRTRRRESSPSARRHPDYTSSRRDQPVVASSFKSSKRGPDPSVQPAVDVAWQLRDA